MASNSFSRIFIKLAANVGCVIMGYSFYEMYQKENSMRKYEALKYLYYDSYVRHKKRMGQEFTDDDYSEEDRKYVEEHFGRKLAERVYTQHLAEDQIKMALQRKKEVRDKMKENLSEDELAKVDDEIKRLDDAFTRLKPKVIPRIAEFVTDKDR